MNAVKAMLWALLALCLGANIAVSLAMKHGSMEILMSVLTGLGTLGAITGLVMLRRTAP